MSRPGVRRWVQIDGKLIDKDTLPTREPGLTIIESAYSKNPVVSPVDHKLIDSRKALREHNARLGVADVGNDGAFKRPSRPTLDRGNLRGDIERAFAQAGA